MRLRLNLILALGLPLAWAAPAGAATIKYNRDIRPILSDNCFACHGPDKSHRKAKLRLDIREEALAKEAFVPGKPDDSELYRRLITEKEDDLMPPPDSHKKLTAAQKNLLKQWIAEGAPYEPHWSYIPPQRPPVPKVKAPAAAVKNPIDAFIIAELEKQRLRPSAPAGRAALLRRLSFDLTGLPPTPEQLNAFLKDKSKDAYAQQVERLLASPHYGERMAVPWLDVVRFTDTVGYHGDQNANVFPYRDYVINAFNRNKPFDQFTIEQLAGDLLPNNTAEQRIATGFNRLNMMTREGGAQPKEYLAKYGADRARTVGMAWLGLTVGCAECHDHKFDPFTTRDFYSLKAFFADVKQWGVYSDYKYTPNPDLKGWNNDYPFPPEEVVDNDYLKQRAAKLRSRINDLAERTAVQATEPQRAAMQSWQGELKAAFAGGDGWIGTKPLAQVLTNITVVTNKTKLTNVVAATEGTPAKTNVTTKVSYKTNSIVATNFVVEPGGIMVFNNRSGGPLPLRLSAGHVAALRVELLPREKNGGSILRDNKSTETLQLSATLQRAGEKKEIKLAFHHADADHKEPRYANGFEILGIRDSWKLSRDRLKEKQTGVWLLDPPLVVKDGDTLRINLKTNSLGAARVSVSPLAPQRAAARLAQPSAEREIRAAWLASTAPETNAFAEFKKLHRDLVECRDGRSPTLVTVAWKPEVVRVLPRGNWQAENGDIVSPQTPHFLPGASTATNLSRLDLARWLVAADNPLTARVVVNRLWRQFFGNGLANPVDDLGSQGEPPSHPELLDWLAVEFRASGWDVKHMVRLFVNSATYQQSANLRPELRDTDPNNRLLASQNPRRLEAEFVRDNALAIAGLLNLDLGGPSAHPYQPGGYYSNLQFPDRDYLASQDDRQYRRGLYTHWQRTFLHPMLANFDAPAREECTAARTASNTPQQALTLLNDPTFFEASRAWAANLLQSPAKSDDARLELAFQRALGRDPKKSERTSLKKFLTSQREHYAQHKEEPAKLQKVGLTPVPVGLDAAELAVWTQTARVILNLHETITRY